MCKRRCDRFCSNLIFSDSVTVGTIDATPSLLIDVPDVGYFNCRKFCLGVIQSIPDTATVNMPVYITIGGDATVGYPLVDCNGLQLVASQIENRYKYKIQVFRNLTIGVFKVYNLPNCYRQTVLTAINET